MKWGYQGEDMETREPLSPPVKEPEKPVGLNDIYDQLRKIKRIMLWVWIYLPLIAGIIWLIILSNKSSY